MLVRKGQLLDLKEVTLPQQAIFVNNKCMCCQLCLQSGAQSPECVSMVRFDIKLSV